jgi:L,D-transpeptidase catalytic domain/Putative peptidoglycan binding domain
MRERIGALAFACLLLVLAGFAAASVLTTSSAAQSPPPPTQPPPPPTTTTTPPPEPPPEFIPQGVTVGGVNVGGLLLDQAYREVEDASADPLVLAFAGRTFVISPKKLGTRMLVRQAVNDALEAVPGEAVHLPVRVRGDAVRAYVRSLAKELDRKPIDARFRLRRERPWISRERRGRKLDVLRTTKDIVDALATNDRDLITLRVKKLKPRVTRRSLTTPVIVIHRESRRLRLFRGMRLWRDFGIAVGQSSWPTPIGRFEIIVMHRNPWWFPPASSWAQGASPIPPGAGNPLGTRWMGLSSPGVGIHGTPDAASIGYSASHGCIRMHIPSAEWLFRRVTVGTPVYILRS